MTLKEFDDSYRTDEIEFIAGLDEAGRGPICGPVVCACVVLDRNFDNSLINDSKKLTAKRRKELVPIIKQNAAAYSIVFIDAVTIDRINILEASRNGMQCALNKLKVSRKRVDFVLTDYMELVEESLDVVPLVKGDSKSLAIACASILAKEARDDYMCELDKIYPEYEFKKHKGYPTKRHLELAARYGVIDKLYRYSYKPVKKTISEKQTIKLF